MKIFSIFVGKVYVQKLPFKNKPENYSLKYIVWQLAPASSNTTILNFISNKCKYILFQIKMLQMLNILFFKISLK